MVRGELCTQGVTENDFKDAESFVEATRYGEVPFVEAKRLVELTVRRSELRHKPLRRERNGDACRVRLVHNHCCLSRGNLNIEDPGRPLREQVSGVTACSGYPSPPTRVVDCTGSARRRVATRAQTSIVASVGPAATRGDPQQVRQESGTHDHHQPWTRRCVRSRLRSGRRPETIRVSGARKGSPCRSCRPGSL